MTDRSFKLGAFFMLIGISALISFGFFGASVTHSQNWDHKIEVDLYKLQTKVDSLEHVINTNFKERRDTTIIQVVPQAIKIYHNQELNSTKTNN